MRAGLSAGELNRITRAESSARVVHLAALRRSIMNNEGVMAADKTIRLNPVKSLPK